MPKLNGRTITQDQKDGLDGAVAEANNPLIAHNEQFPDSPKTLWTPETYFDARIDDMLNSYAAQHVEPLGDLIADLNSDDLAVRKAVRKAARKAAKDARDAKPV